MANEQQISSRFLKKEESGAGNGTVSKKRRVSAHGRPSEVPQIKETGDRIGKKRKMKKPLVTFKLFWSREELMEEQRKMMEEYNLSNSKQC